tara:strand:+ start:8820 stop:10433 length:1614 start_codon:yes stop_codon:yes gene_type:complete
MVNFNWGKQTLSLPRSASFIETQMKDYILNGDKEFRRKMRKAIESVEESEPNSAALKSELTKILEKVLDEPLKPILERDTDSWKIFSRKRDKSPNEANLSFIEDKKVKDITNARVLGRLKGTDVSFIRGGKTKLPDFDFDDFFSAYGKEPRVAFDFVFREHSKFNDRFNYSHQPARSGLKGHIEAIFPHFDYGDLEKVKSDYILETTGQEAGYRPSNTKTIIGKEVIDYSFNIPESVLEQLDKVSAQDNYVMEAKLNEDGEFESVGDKIPISESTDNEINNLVVQAATDDLNRTDKMRDEDIIQIGDKYYTFNYTPEGESAKQAYLEFEGDGAGTIDGFFKDEGVKNIIMRILNPFLVVPDEVYSFKVIGNIRTKKKTEPTYREFATAADDLVEMETGKPVTQQMVDEQSKRAFSHKTKKDEDGNKIFISEEEYAKLSREEKENYKSEIRYYEVGETGVQRTKESAEFGKEKVKAETVRADDIKEAFKEAYVELTFEARKHGEYNLSGSRSRQNRSMVSYSNKLKKNVRKLKRMIGV